MSFLNRSYFKLLLSGLISTSALLVSAMIGGLAAGRYLSPEGLTAVSLASPFFSLNSFFASMVLSGGCISVYQSLGAKNKKQADLQFSNVLYAQLAIGLLFSLSSVLLLDRLPVIFGGAGETRELMGQYLGGVAPFMLVFSVAEFMSSIAYYDGNVKVVTLGRVLNIAANILLSVVMTKRLGIRGTALAVVVSECLSCAVYSLHFIGKKCPLRLVRRLDLGEIVRMSRVGLPGISVYVIVAVSTVIVNNYLSRCHGAYTLYVFSIANMLVGAFANLPCAAGEALAPMASVYVGEDNRLMLRRLLGLSVKSSLALSLLAVLPVVCFPARVCALYSVDASAVADVTRALRMAVPSLILMGVGNLFTIYYMVRGYTLLALGASVLRCLVFYAGSFLLLGSLAPDYIWLSFPLSEALLLLTLLGLTSLMGRSEGLRPMVLLKPTDRERFRVWDFPAQVERFLSCGQEAESALLSAGVTQARAQNATLILEELGLLLSQYRCRVEVDLLIRQQIELIVRDTSPKWDIAQEDALPQSLQHYCALQILNRKARKEYFRIIGCNRISFIL